MKEEYNVTIHRDKTTGHMTLEAWTATKTGRYYNPTGPARRRWDKNGSLKEERWCDENHREHRDGGQPSWIERDPDTGVVFVEHYCVHGQFHRNGEDLPSVINRNYKNGETLCEMYYVDGERHRDDGKPAIIRKHHKTGVAYHESVWEMGHCISVIERDKQSGAVTYTGPPQNTHLSKYGSKKNHANEFHAD